VRVGVVELAERSAGIKFDAVQIYREVGCRGSDGGVAA
jgi:hypothetical protein